MVRSAIVQLTMSELNTNSSSGDLDPEQLHFEMGRIVMHEQDIVITEYAESGFEDLVGFLETESPQPVQLQVVEQKRFAEDIVGYVCVIGAGIIINSLLGKRNGRQ